MSKDFFDVSAAKADGAMSERSGETGET